MKLIAFFASCLCYISSYGQNNRICITIDDVPAVTYGNNNPAQKIEITKRLITTFKTFNIPAIGYVVEGQLYQNGKLDTNAVKTLSIWLENGYELGNHTFSHYDYNKVPDSIFFQDILKGEKVTKDLVKRYYKELNYFRHPYLHTGINLDKHNALQKFLSKNGYIISPVTIDNDDYLFAKAYHNAAVKDDDTTMKKIGKSYVDYMEDKLAFYEKKSIEVFSRNITQTLLLHASLLNADYMDELAEMLKSRGYDFVSQEETLKDEAYATAVTKFSEKGLSWIFRWGLSKGKSADFMSNDPEVPEEIIMLQNE